MISFAPLPERICARGRADAPAHWLSSMYLYCTHARLLAVRVPGTQSWSFWERVTGKQASAALTRSAPDMNRVLERWARAQGISKQECDRRFTAAWLAFLASPECSITK